MIALLRNCSHMIRLVDAFSSRLHAFCAIKIHCQHTKPSGNRVCYLLPVGLSACERQRRYKSAVSQSNHCSFPEKASHLYNSKLHELGHSARTNFLTVFLNNSPHIMVYNNLLLPSSIQDTLPYILVTAALFCTLPLLRTWVRAMTCAANFSKHSIPCA